MYGKLVEGQLVEAPYKMLQYDYNGKHICALNPTAENYIQAGYKVVEYGEIPESESEQVYEVIYEETDDKIVVKYVIGGGE